MKDLESRRAVNKKLTCRVGVETLDLGVFLFVISGFVEAIKLSSNFARFCKTSSSGTPWNRPKSSHCFLKNFRVLGDGLGPLKKRMVIKII